MRRKGSRRIQARSLCAPSKWRRRLRTNFDIRRSLTAVSNSPINCGNRDTTSRETGLRVGPMMSAATRMTPGIAGRSERCGRPATLRRFSGRGNFNRTMRNAPGRATPGGSWAEQLSVPAFSRKPSAPHYSLVKVPQPETGWLNEGEHRLGPGGLALWQLLPSRNLNAWVLERTAATSWSHQARSVRARGDVCGVRRAELKIVKLRSSVAAAVSHFCWLAPNADPGSRQPISFAITAVPSRQR